MGDFTVLGPTEIGVVASPIRQQLLRDLASPGSAAGLARRYDMSRQRIGYHMRDLERAGCIEAAGTRQQRGLTEKLYRARPLAYVHAPPAAERLRRRERFSWAALVSLLGRSLGALISLRRAADANGKHLATLGLEAELHFDTPAQRRAFTEDLLDAVEGVLRRHERSKQDGSRSFRLIVGAFPQPVEEHVEEA